MDFLDFFSERLAKHRKIKCFTQEKLSEKVLEELKKYVSLNINQGLPEDKKPDYSNVKIARTEAINWEKPYNRVFPGTVRLIAISKVLGVSTDYLLGLTDDPTPPEPAK